MRYRRPVPELFARSNVRNAGQEKSTAAMPFMTGRRSSAKTISIRGMLMTAPAETGPS
jgi:hypothetical protein